MRRDSSGGGAGLGGGVRKNWRVPNRRRANHPRLQLAGALCDSRGWPVWNGGAQGEPEALAGCYHRSLALAAENGAKSVAFPCVSTGIFGYPPESAAKTAVDAVRKFLSESDGEGLEEIIFCCFGASDLEIYRRILES